MGDQIDFAFRRLQPSILLLHADIPHVIWGQDAVEFCFGGPFNFYDELDLQILLPPSKIQEAVKLLAPSYSTMTCDDIDEEKMTVDKRLACVDYTLAFRDRPDDFVRLKLLRQNTDTVPSHVLLISNTIFDYPLDDVVQVPLPLCPDLPFPSVPAIVGLMPVHIQKWFKAGFSRQSLSFICACRTLLESAIEFSFCEELDTVFSDVDQLPTRLKEMICGLDEHQKTYVYDFFPIGEPGGSSSDSDGDIVWPNGFTLPPIPRTDSQGANDPPE
ncbi:uncharacterized protein EV420DRAFT_1758094 [Desarmillaria tabescens]|uniref:Uncharacterized protein n=1 Tax=Armillaria tabescens TaxID=1929756 RepID=A0AA39NLW2_ARMTA|nr:uncharacterized protein EV420DRAFT_1758094 [Desarmillaria tabescens]KAK0467858.1 hypothetical protein EV420DRAFT_1758094 [Desarmillaria tabescens]